MDVFYKLLERFLSSVLLSLLMAMISFSFFTGKFPPRKEDMIKAVRLTSQLVVGTKPLQQAAAGVQSAQAQGGPPNMEQLAELQRMALRRTEVTIELIKIFKRFEGAPPSDQVGEKLQAIASHMQAVEQGLNEVNQDLSQTLNGGQ